MKPETITTIDIDGLRVAHVVIGDGMPLLMLHGWGADSRLVLPLAERLAPQGYCCHLLDLPGFGQSDAPPAAWSVHEYVALVVAYLAAQQLEQVHLFGHSFGGRLGLVLGAEHPDRIDRMVLADSAGVRPKPSPVGDLRLKSYKLIRDGLYQIGAKNLADDLRAWYNERYGSADFQSAAGVMRETFVRVVNEDLLPSAARVAAPTLLFWGEHDEDTPLWQGELLEKTIPDAGLVVLSGAGHYSYLDKLAETVRVMDYFFKQTQ